MGISGLLPLLKDIHTQKHVADYRGQTLGVDAYVWLHRGAYACARDIVLGKPTTAYVAYALGRIRMLQHHGVHPYIVFDGDKLPAKQGTEDQRQQSRQNSLQRAQALEREGRLTEAREIYAKCVDITPEMAYQLIKILRRQNVPYLVAPYEADAQLAYLERRGIIDGIITEDSDLLVFGCQKVLFKLDQAGSCTEILRSRFALNRQLVLSGWTPVEFRQMAILSGCDYLPSISGMGLKNAHRLLRRYKTVEKVLQAVRLEGKLRVPTNYAREFRKAELTFVHQRVWDPQQGRMTTLTPLPDGTADEMVPFIGAPIEDHLARQIAEGDVDPLSRLSMVDLVPSQKLGTASMPLATRSVSGPGQASPFSRSTTMATSASARASTSSFYRTGTQSVAKRSVSTEAGLQTIKNFFGAKASAKPTVAAEGEKSGAGPMGELDPNLLPLRSRASSSNPFAVDKGKRKASDDARIVDLDGGATPRSSSTGPESPQSCTRSKFFKRSSQDRKEAVRGGALANYLELDGRTPRVPGLGSSQATPSRIWDGCADLDEFLRSSPPQCDGLGVGAGSLRAKGRLDHLIDSDVTSSSPFATPRDEEAANDGVRRGLEDGYDDGAASSIISSTMAAAATTVITTTDAAATPVKRRRRRSFTDAVGSRTSSGAGPDPDAAHDSDHSSGFISSPASSTKPHRHRRTSSDLAIGLDDEDDTMPSSPLSPIKPRTAAKRDVADRPAPPTTADSTACTTSLEALASSDPIEAEDDEDNAATPAARLRRGRDAAARAVGRSLMAQFGFHPVDAARSGACGGGGGTTPSIPRRSWSDLTPTRTKSTVPSLVLQSVSDCTATPDCARGAHTHTPVRRDSGRLRPGTTGWITPAGRGDGEGKGERSGMLRRTGVEWEKGCEGGEGRPDGLGRSVSVGGMGVGSEGRGKGLERFRFAGAR